jgi:hypothetical protein
MYQKCSKIPSGNPALKPLNLTDPNPSCALLVDPGDEITSAPFTTTTLAL